MVYTEEMEVTPWELDRWIREAGQGDRESLRLLYRAAAPAVYAYAMSILKNRFDAEDVLQDCFLMVQKGGQYTQQGKPMAWLMTVTRNLCVSQLRKQSRTVPLTGQELTAADVPNPESRLIIQNCLQNLGDEERQIVVLHAVAGFTCREIGQHLGLKTPTVITKYRRAIQKLKSML